MREPKFLTDRRRREEDMPVAPPRGAIAAMISPARPQDTEASDWRNPIPEQTAEEVVHSLPGPLQSVARGIGDALVGLQTPPRHPGLSPRQMGAPLAPASPNPNKQVDKVRDEGAMRAAVQGGAGGTPVRGQAGDQKPSPDTGTPPMEKRGTGPGAASPTPTQAPAGAPAIGPSSRFVRLPDGKIVNVTEGQGKDYIGAGGQYVSWQDAMARQRGGAEQASRFMRDRQFRDTSGDIPGATYSEKVRALANVDAPDLSTEGGVGFGLGAPASGGPIQGYRKLSGLEQAIERRRWLEGRANAEQQNEVVRAELDKRRKLAEMDPLELARIEAQGRMGGDVAKVELEQASRIAALSAYQQKTQQIEVLRDQLAKLPAGDPQAQMYQDEIAALQLQAREIANILLGRYVANPNRQDFGELLATALAGGGMGGGGTPPAGGAAPSGAR